MDNENAGAAAAGSFLAPLLPTEPFPCPHCGQMLAPSCRLCVACRQPIDIAQIRGPEPHILPGSPPDTAPAAIRSAHFSWSIFFIVLAAAFVLVSIAVRLVGRETSELVFTGITFACAGWVYMDARAKGLPRPWRWSIMTLFFWLIFFPWYLGRRRTPQAPCSVMESAHSVFFRALFWFVLIVIFLSFIAAVVKTPPH
ncbi:MAG: hypothetical protein ACRD3O_06900 [Terriglobia bacterium]